MFYSIIQNTNFVLYNMSMCFFLHGPLAQSRPTRWTEDDGRFEASRQFLARSVRKLQSYKVFTTVGIFHVGPVGHHI